MIRVSFVGCGGMFIPLAFVCSFIMGHVGSNDANLEMSQYLATRPITNADYARIILKTAALSVLFA